MDADIINDDTSDYKSVAELNAAFHAANINKTFNCACNKAYVSGDLTEIKELIRDENNNFLSEQNINKSFLVACTEGDLDFIKYLVEERRAHLHPTGIRYACYHGRLSVVKYLIEAGNVSKIDELNHAFVEACSGGNVDIVKYLVETHGVKVFTLGLTWASKYSRLEVIRYLIEIDNKLLKTINMSNFTDLIPLLLNVGLDHKILGSYADPYVTTRKKRNEKIANAILEVTGLCKDVVNVVCEYSQY